MPENTTSPRQELRAAKQKFTKAQETFAKAQLEWQKSRRKFTDTLAFGTEAANDAEAESTDD